MFVVEVVAALTTLLFLRDLVTGAGGLRVLVPDHSLALVHRAVRQLRRSGGRGARQGAGRHPAQDQDRDDGQAAGRVRAGEWQQVPATSLKPAMSCWSRPATSSRRDGEVIEGVASVDEAAITGEIAPVIRESGGDRSAVTGGTRGHLGLDQGADHRGAGRDLPRPHDRAGRGRRAAEDAERDRAQHPARRHDADLRLRRRDDPELCRPMPAAASACWCWSRCSSP